jgi:hypothetical protein
MEEQFRKCFLSFIRSALRQKSRFWAPNTETKLKGYTIGGFEYQCSGFVHHEKNVDHLLVSR